MTSIRLVLVLALLTAVPAAAAAQPYSARDADGIVRLADAATNTVVSILPSIGNIVIGMNVHGHEILRWPYESPAAFKARPALSGIPLLAPWANRLDEAAFYANGRKYTFDPGLGNVRSPIPIHGLVSTTDKWQFVEARADARSAWATSRLEFHREPAWMKQWPFAHTIEITHVLREGVLEVRTTITNLSADPMPVAIGFHPYFQLSDAPRDDWRIAVAARTHWLLSPAKLPTGETEPIEQLFPNPQSAALREHALDDVFTDLVRGADGRASMAVMGRAQRIDVLFGPNYRSVVIFSPNPSTFICFEPMAGPTNALNLAQRGVYKDLQTIPPGGTWRESFWVKPTGFQPQR